MLNASYSGVVHYRLKSAAQALSISVSAQRPTEIVESIREHMIDLTSLQGEVTDMLITEMPEGERIDALTLDEIAVPFIKRLGIRDKAKLRALMRVDCFVMRFFGGRIVP